MANDIYSYDQYGTSKAMEDQKLNDLRNNLANLRGYTEEDIRSLGPQTEQRTRQVARAAYGREIGPQYETQSYTYTLTPEEQLARGRIAYQDKLNALQSKLDNPATAVSNDPREQDYYRGVRAGEALLGQNGLGRLGNDQQIQDVMSQYKQYADQGYSSPVLEAQRQQMQDEINRNTATQSRQLSGQLARAGVKGAAAGAQFGALQGAAMQQKGALERDIFIKNADLMQNSLEKYGQALGQVKSFDLGQVAKEKNIIFQSGMGFQQTGQAERSAQAQADAARSAQAAASGGGKIICTELFHQGLMPKEIYEKDQAFGHKLLKEDPELIHGYWILATPVVNLMRKSKAFTKYVVKPIANGWAYHIAGQENLCGLFVYSIGSFLCRAAYKFSESSLAISRSWR